MSWSTRRAIVVLGAVTFFGTLTRLQLSLAQEKVPIGRAKRPPVFPPDGTGGPVKPMLDSTEIAGFTLPMEESLKGKLDAINVFIKVKDWVSAVDRLQTLLD